MRGRGRTARVLGVLLGVLLVAGVAGKTVEVQVNVDGDYDGDDDDVIDLAGDVIAAPAVAARAPEGDTALVGLSASADPPPPPASAGEEGRAPCPAVHGKECNDNGACTGGACVCNEGWVGQACENDTCPNHCNGRGVCEAGICHCNKGWIRSDCSVSTCPQNCSFHGDCVDGKCQCHTGWQGESCDDNTCPKHCSGNGNCTSGRCKCLRGWQGRACDVDTCPNHCSNNGNCTLGNCTCAPGWSGHDCSIDPCPDQCSSHGTCTVDIAECTCELGWRGEACNTPVCPNDCNAALHHGSCIWGGIPGSPPKTHCRCVAGWTGDDCGEMTCPNNCSRRGKCWKGRCLCMKGYTSDDCSLLNECPNHCSGHGICSQGKCECENGWRGEDCALSTCPHACYGRGDCVSGMCQCYPMYAGETCEKDACPSRCSGHGMCRDGNCTCMAGWTGFDCSQSVCPSGCSGHGNCHHDIKKCECWYGWGGQADDCSQELCVNFNDCSNNGYCDNGKCVCDEGWTGDDCDTDVCPMHCSGQGSCTKGKCFCNEGWTGSICSVRAPTYVEQPEEEVHHVGEIVEMDPEMVRIMEEDAAAEQARLDRHYVPTVPGMERETVTREGVEVLDPKFDDYITAQLHECPNFCGGHGECVLGKCKCDRGWAGEECTTPLCPPYGDSAKGGTGGRLSGIDMSKKGYTPHGYSNMEYYPCNGNGDCLNGDCACFMGWSGDDCSILQSKGFTGPSPDMTRYLHAEHQPIEYGCENSRLVLSCDELEHEDYLEPPSLHIVTANYGRTDVVHCLRGSKPDGRAEGAMRGHGYASKYGNTTSKCKYDVTDNIRNQCEQKPWCDVPVSNHEFGDDPCPDQFKFLTVKYTCRKILAPTPTPTHVEIDEPSPTIAPTPTPTILFDVNNNTCRQQTTVDGITNQDVLSMCLRQAIHGIWCVVDMMPVSLHWGPVAQRTFMDELGKTTIVGLQGSNIKLVDDALEVINGTGLQHQRYQALIAMESSLRVVFYVVMSQPGRSVGENMRSKINNAITNGELATDLVEHGVEVQEITLVSSVVEEMALILNRVESLKPVESITEELENARYPTVSPAPHVQPVLGGGLDGIVLPPPSNQTEEERARRAAGSNDTNTSNASEAVFTSVDDEAVSSSGSSNTVVLAAAGAVGVVAVVLAATKFTKQRLETMSGSKGFM